MKWNLSWAVNIRLAWDPPNNPPPDLAGYKVYYGHASRNYGPPIDVGNVTTYLLTNIDPKQIYFFAVTAYDTSNNESEFSNEVRWPALKIVDVDKDNKTDFAIFRSKNGQWWIKPSSGLPPYKLDWGGDPTDRPLAGDFDGDGKTDIAIYRTGVGAWYIVPSSGAKSYGIGWGGDPSDKPVLGDFDGDGRTDIAIYRAINGAWYIVPSSGVQPYGIGFGGDPTDKPVPGDYDGDGKTDIAVYRASNGAWYIYPSGGGLPYGIGWGGDPTDIPVTLILSAIE
ncbi:MAG: FG-GAP-like repeat-containing protein [candidate division WOR-3 bacterium]